MDAAPAAPQAIPGLIPMQSPSDRRAEESLRLQQDNAAFQREQAAQRAEMDRRRLELAEQQAGLRGNRYQNKFDEARATRDATRFDQAMTGWADAPGLEAGGQRAERLLEDGAPVGAFADQRIAAGRIAGDFLGFLPGIPNREQTQQLEQLRLLGSQGALGDVSQLKGPLSEKELAFIQRLQIDPNATRETNMQVAEAMQWAARRQAAYGAAMERWVQELGSPSAPNANGLTFNAWWGQYASRALPRPGSPEAAARREDTVEAVPIAANGEGGGMGGGPGAPAPQGPVDISGMSAAELLQLQPGTAIRLPDGTITRLTGAPSVGAQGREVSPGVFAQEIDRDPDAQAQVEAQSNVPGWWRNIEAAANAAAEQIPLLDEAAAWTAGQLSGVDYESARNVQKDVADFDRENYRGARNAGGIAGGAALIATPLGAPIRATRGATLAGRTVNRATGGALAGGAWGFGQGEGNALERLPEAGAGAGVGAVAGPAAPVVGNALARGAAPVVRGVQAFNRAVARPIVNALGERAPAELVDMVQPNPLASGVGRLADRMGEGRVNALAPALAERRAAGIDDATLVDVLDDASIGRIRALATRDTPARDQAVRFAERRRANLPSRASRIAREEISSDTRPALDIIDSQKAARRANASAIDAFGNDPVPVSPDVVMALRSDFVRPHLAAAARRAQGATDPAEREASARLSRLADMALDNPSGAQLTVRDAQDISRALNDAATAAYRAGSPDGPVLANLANTIRGSARESSEGYANWLRQYGEDSDLIEAATRGRNFVSVSNNPINARSTEAFVRGASDAGPAEQTIQRAVSREAVEVAGSNPKGARGVLEAFASDADQARRAQAIGVDPSRLQTRATAELEAVTRAQRASPRVGSESSTNLQDAGNAAGVALRAIRQPLTAGAEWAVNRIISRGFNDAEAQAIVEAAINPARTQEMIDMLAQRMTRREARNLARAVRYQLTTGPQSGQQQ